MKIECGFLAKLLIVTSASIACATPPHEPAGSGVAGDSASTIIQPSGADDTGATECVPGLAGIGVSFMLDPLLTRSMYMGDRWVRRDTFEHVVQPGSVGSLDVRVVGLDRQGRELDVVLTADWIPIDSDGISVAPARGSRTMITMRSPGEGLLRVTCGELTEALRLQARYDRAKDATQLVIVRERGAPTVTNHPTTGPDAR